MSTWERLCEYTGISINWSEFLNFNDPSIMWNASQTIFVLRLFLMRFCDSIKLKKLQQTLRNYLHSILALFMSYEAQKINFEENIEASTKIQWHDSIMVDWMLCSVSNNTTIFSTFFHQRLQYKLKIFELTEYLLSTYCYIIFRILFRYMLLTCG